MTNDDQRITIMMTIRRFQVRHSSVANLDGNLTSKSVPGQQQTVSFYKCPFFENLEAPRSKLVRDNYSQYFSASIETNGLRWFYLCSLINKKVRRSDEIYFNVEINKFSPFSKIWDRTTKEHHIKYLKVPRTVAQTHHGRRKLLLNLFTDDHPSR